MPWSSLSLVGVTAQNATLWKLFSPDQVPHAWLSIIFEGEFEVVAQRTWPAYPAFDPPEDFARWRLADGLVYLNAIENAASAMEMSAIAGERRRVLVHVAAGPGESEGHGVGSPLAGRGVGRRVACLHDECLRLVLAARRAPCQHAGCPQGEPSSSCVWRQLVVATTQPLRSGCLLPCRPEWRTAGGGAPPGQRISSRCCRCSCRLRLRLSLFPCASLCSWHVSGLLASYPAV